MIAAFAQHVDPGDFITWCYWRAYAPDESDHAAELHIWIGWHGTLDQQISVAEEKYAAALENLERHLFGFGKALRGDLHRIIEGEIVKPAVGELPAAQAHGLRE